MAGLNASGPERGPLPPDPRETFRCFWHGPPLTAYEVLSLRSVLAQGHRVVLYRYDPTLAVPEGVETGDANEILPTETVLSYRAGPGAGSYALHANLFRYALLARLGEWYIDTDVVMLKRQPPAVETFAAWQTAELAAVGVLRAPPGAALFEEALHRARALAPRAEWGETGPRLFTELLRAHGLTDRVWPQHSTYPLHWSEFLKFFLPDQREAIDARTAGSHFVHFWHEMIRRAGIPKDAAPPRGSWFDARFRQHGIAFPSADVLTVEFLRGLARSP